MKNKRQPKPVMIDPDDPLHEAMSKIPLSTWIERFPPKSAKKRQDGVERRSPDPDPDPDPDPT